MVQNIVAGKFRGPKYQYGVTYLWLLFIIFLMGIGLGKSIEIYSKIEQRKKEQELIYIGLLYRDAIRQYYISGQNEHKYPTEMRQLLKDPRYIVIRRYLRTLYNDPITNRPFILIYAAEGGICGVKSSSKKQPIRSNFNQIELTSFNFVKSYEQWEFRYEC